MKPNADWNDVSRKIKECYQEIHCWMSANFLRLNDEKTELIIFKRPHDTINRVNLSLRCGDSVLSPVDWVRDLGVILDSSATMERHVNNIAKTCRFHLRKISKIRRYLNKDACQSLVQATVTARLDYANSLLYGLPKVQLNKLKKVQNGAARIILCSGRREHITPALIDLHWLPVERRIEYKIILLTFKALNGLAPLHLRQALEVPPPRQRRHQNENKLVVPRCRCKTFGGRSFRVGAPELWNSLPPHLRCHEMNIHSFKQQLKTFLFRSAYF